MPTRAAALLALPLLLLAACEKQESGPIAVSAIGGAPALANPSAGPLDAPSAFLVDSAAQGLVRFDSAGQIEPALAQRWIVSDDGLDYTFRLARAEWIGGGGRVTAFQVVPRLKLAMARASRNPLKPVLGAIESIEAMTDEVLVIRLKAPRPNFLQLLGQPEMGILRAGRGTGPFRAAGGPDNSVTLEPVAGPDEEEGSAPRPPPLLLRGEPAARAVARFSLGGADLVLGGTAADLPVAQAAGLGGARLVFDPVAGLFGLAFVRGEGPFADPAARRALAMAVDRAGIAAAFAVPGLQPRDSLVPAGVQELPQPALPDWSPLPLADRRAAAARAIAALAGDTRPTVRVAMPDGPGYRLLFAYLRRDWRLIGVDAERVPASAPADLRLVDVAAPANLSTWYLRTFTCDGAFVCDPAADEMLDAARLAPAAGARRALLANADRILAAVQPFIPLTAPVRWSLVSARLTGFHANPFGRHPAGELVAPAP
jgi:oligopeptide transport system substrate-binding protein